LFFPPTPRGLCVFPSVGVFSQRTSFSRVFPLPRRHFQAPRAECFPPSSLIFSVPGSTPFYYILFFFLLSFSRGDRFRKSQGPFSFLTPPFSSRLALVSLWLHRFFLFSVSPHRLFTRGLPRVFSFFSTLIMDPKLLPPLVLFLSQVLPLARITRQKLFPSPSSPLSIGPFRMFPTPASLRSAGEPIAVLFPPPTCLQDRFLFLFSAPDGLMVTCVNDTFPALGKPLRFTIALFQLHPLPRKFCLVP